MLNGDLDNLISAGYAAFLQSAPYTRLRYNSRRVQSICLFALFLLPFLIFTNLYRIHTYYQCANAVFLSASFGIVIAGALERAGPVVSRNVTISCFLVIVLFCGNSLWYFNFRSTYKSKYADIASYIASNTKSDDVLLIVGMDYSAEIPYYAKRKAVMLPDSFPDDVAESALRDIQEDKETIGAFVSCENAGKAALVGKYFYMNDRYDFYGDECEIYLRPKPKPI